MKHTFLLLVMCGLLSACVGRVLPLRMVTDKDEVFTGELKWSPSEGTAQVTGPNGMTCKGTYDQFNNVQIVKMYVSCSDGRHGTVTAIRDLPLGCGHGTGSGKLSDGTQLTFAWGQTRIDGMTQ